MYISQQHLKAIQRRIDFLTERIDDSTAKSTGYDEAERAALRAALHYIDDEQSNVHQQRAFMNGQKTLLKFYKKQLKNAVRSNNVSALQFLLDRTTEWLEKAEDENKDATS